MSNQTKITYEVFTSSQNGYERTNLIISSKCVEDTQKWLEEATNKSAFQALLDEGHPVHYSNDSSGVCIQIEWLHYNGGGIAFPYCAPTFLSLGEGFSQIERGVALLKKLGKKLERNRGYDKVGSHTFSDPRDLLKVLASMKGYVQVVRHPGNFSIHVPVLENLQNLQCA